MKILQDYLQLSGMSAREFAARLEMSETQLNHYVKGRMEPGAKVLKRLSDSTGIKIHRLVESANA